MQVLSQILDSVAGMKKQTPPGRPLVIFDLDSTLYDLSLRVTAILAYYAANEAPRFPVECAKLKDVVIQPGDWGLDRPFARVGITRRTHPEFWKDVHAHWARGFFSNQFLDRDFPLPGAVEYVHRLRRRDAHVLYLTGRDTKRMGEGTALSLRETGFPLDEAARLHLKPHHGLDDAQFKADVIAGLTEEYDRVWLFENEPVNINAVRKRTPSVEIVYVETCHSGLEEVTKEVPRIQTFAIDKDQ